jgi:hypothetical protein
MVLNRTTKTFRATPPPNRSRREKKLETCKPVDKDCSENKSSKVRTTNGSEKLRACAIQREKEIQIVCSPTRDVKRVRKDKEGKYRHG